MCPSKVERKVNLSVKMQTPTKEKCCFYSFEWNEVLNQSYIDGTSLVIHDLTGKDDGEYTCELETKVLVISFAYYCPNV